eukprot:gnl/TRDRNA2_/TRDRNA2_195908_c0_seq1.p1 gnl/TRDRNA2_/TRDRNA2_195908_c0~~gnl/TRDRNA2_/TRDRNA2_195908_c0_seq1.p1  ORF type:complete len:189 (-),score=16.15 gnl/TRDRNA2_/TRDRNA2_195908_c0_seq1:58-624(-)
MGSVFSRVEAAQRDAALLAKVSDARQQKVVRDTEQSMRVALVRDRILWVTAYYGAVGLVSAMRHLAMHRRGIHFTFDNFFLPLNVVVVIIPPFALGYQIDYAYYDKANRIAEEAKRIRSGDAHHWFGHPWLPIARSDADMWFNQPMVLPAMLKPAYSKYMTELNRLQNEAGEPPMKDWAVFSAPRPSE